MESSGQVHSIKCFSRIGAQISTQCSRTLVWIQQELASTSTARLQVCVSSGCARIFLSVSVYTSCLVCHAAMHLSSDHSSSVITLRRVCKQDSNLCYLCVLRSSEPRMSVSSLELYKAYNVLICQWQVRGKLNHWNRSPKFSFELGEPCHCSFSCNIIMSILLCIAVHGNCKHMTWIVIRKGHTKERMFASTLVYMYMYMYIVRSYMYMYNCL